MLANTRRLKKIIYYVLVYNEYDNDKVKCELIVDKHKYTVSLIYCNKDFMDVGTLQFQPCELVKKTIKEAIQQTINSL